MKIRDVIDQDLPCCAPEEALQQAAERMCLWSCDVLPVCRPDKRFVGSITARAICLQACVSGKPLEALSVRDATSEQELCARADDTVRHTAELMLREKVWQLPVIDAGGRFLGTVSYQRLLREMSGVRDLMVVVPEVSCLDEMRERHDFVPTWTLVTKPRELISPEGKRAQLSRAEARLLLVLAEASGSVMSRDALMRKVLQRPWHPTDRYIDVLVAHLRKKFGERGADARVIRTVPSDGYFFTLRVVDERPRSGEAIPGADARRMEPARGNASMRGVSMVMGASS